MDKIKKGVMYVGNSFSQCIRSILDGTMPIGNVERIEAGTKIPNFESLQNMITEGYFGSRFDADLTLEVIEYLLFRGKIRQCRLEGDWKTCHETWTPSSEWKSKDHQESSTGQKEISDGYTVRLIAKLDAQHSLLEHQEVLDRVRVVEPA